MINKFIKMLREGKRPLIFSKGAMSRNFNYISNNVEANLLACTAHSIGGQVFNIACGQRYTLNQLVDTINTILGTYVEPLYDLERQGDVKHSLAAIDKAKTHLGFEVKTHFKDGLEQLFNQC